MSILLTSHTFQLELADFGLMDEPPLVVIVEVDRVVVFGTPEAVGSQPHVALLAWWVPEPEGPRPTARVIIINRCMIYM